MQSGLRCLLKLVWVDNVVDVYSSRHVTSSDGSSHSTPGGGMKARGKSSGALRELFRSILPQIYKDESMVRLEQLLRSSMHSIDVVRLYVLCRKNHWYKTHIQIAIFLGKLHTNDWIWIVNLSAATVTNPEKLRAAISLKWMKTIATRTWCKFFCANSWNFHWHWHTQTHKHTHAHTLISSHLLARLSSSLFLLFLLQFSNLYNFEFVFFLTDTNGTFFIVLYYIVMNFIPAASVH